MGIADADNFMDRLDEASDASTTDSTAESIADGGRAGRERPAKPTTATAPTASPTPPSGSTDGGREGGQGAATFESHESERNAGHAIDFGLLARAVRDQRCLETLDALWREVFTLESWFFIARHGGEEFPQGVLPQVVERGERRCVLVFTDEFAALRHQSRQSSQWGPSGHGTHTMLDRGEPTRKDGGRASEDGRDFGHVGHVGHVGHAGHAGDAKRAAPRSERQSPSRLGYATIEVDVDASMVVLKKLADEGVVTAIFNDGIAAFEMAIAPLIEVHRRVRRRRDDERPAAAGSDPSSALDVPSEAHAALMATIILPCPPGQVDLDALLAHASLDGDARAAAIAALLMLDAWWFICNPKKPDEVFVARIEGKRDTVPGGHPDGKPDTVRDCRPDGKPTVLVYTDDRQAIIATERHKLVARDGAILLLEMPVRDAIDWIPRFRRHGAEHLTFNERSTPLTVTIAELSEAWQRMQEQTR